MAEAKEADKKAKKPDNGLTKVVMAKNVKHNGHRYNAGEEYELTKKLAEYFREKKFV